MKKEKGERYAASKQWLASVMERSDALDLEQGVFKMNSPEKITASLKHSAEDSHRKKARPINPPCRC
jgi:hypothetical protein